MKCPKCDYLGFETGDRCKNCGYDFSLLTPAEPHEPGADLLIHPSSTDEPPRVTPWLDQLDRMFGEPDPAPVLVPTAPPAPVMEPAAVASVVDRQASAPAEPELRIAPAFALDEQPPLPPPSFRGEPALPLFSPGPDDDEPLVKLPATPRPPLAVRRTPDRPRLRAVSTPPPAPEPTLAFPDADNRTPDLPDARRQPRAPVALEGTISAAGPRVVAALIDQAILFGIDLIVVYFTLRLASLTLADWRALPAVPMIAFLALVKLAYFTAFTAVGGQTIGKMAARIRVITDERGLVDPSRAVRRTLAGAVSFVTLGLAFVPALFGAEHRALHDRIAHTRVVALPSGQA